MSLAVQADAIRVALLNKYGGIWMDSDSIIINGEFIKNFENYELTMVSDTKTKYHYIGFIHASKNSKIIKEWFKQIIAKVKLYRHYFLNQKNNDISENSMKKFRSVKYLGNNILDSLIKNIKENKFLHLDSNEINSFPERKSFKNYSLEFYIKRYKSFYFTKGNPQIILNNTKGLILLHNSWTPLKYKNMSENDFLKQDILLSKLLLQILDPKA